MSSTILTSAGRRLLLALVAAWLALASAAAAQPADKLDPVLRHRARQLSGTSRVIVQYRGRPDVRAITGRGGVVGRELAPVGAYVADVSNLQLARLAGDPRVARVSIDRPAFATMERTAAATGALLARTDFGLSGSGIGVAVIDSGVTGWHGDLLMERGQLYDAWNPRVTHFKDFVNPSPYGYGDAAYDDYGHGTHVAGIVAGNGYESRGARSGVAPKANVIGLKVLDQNGVGYVSNVIAALDYAVAMRHAYNIRIINLSAGAGVYESYDTDPLAQAAKRAVDAGIVVITAAGNLGQNAGKQPQYGGITAPGNAPWVLTVGASSHQGTTARSDDGLAAFSSRGPTWIDFSAKPDLVAPGVGIESAIEPFSALYLRYPSLLLNGASPWLWYKPYQSLSGTSMAAPVVAGTVALLLEANPQLTPNAVKAILQYTAQVIPGRDFLTQGAGLLNARGAVRMARFFANPQAGPGAAADPIAGESAGWSRRIIWGNYRVGGGVPLPGSNAWALGQRWGGTTSAAGRPIVWGAESLDNIVWSMTGTQPVWGYSDGQNLAWSSDDNIVWGMNGADNIVWSMEDLDNIVWSMGGAENIVWGMDCGGPDCSGVLWGARAENGDRWGVLAADDNIVWSMDDNIVWSMLDNIVWSMDDNIVWSMGTVEQTLWGSPAGAARGVDPRLPGRK